MVKALVLNSSYKRQLVIVLFLLLLFQLAGNAQKVTTGSEYVWTTPGTWSPLGAPASTYNNTVTVNSPLTIDQDLTIANGSGNYIFNNYVTDQPGGTDYNLIATTNGGRLEVTSGTTTFEGNANRLTGSTIIVRSGATLILGKPGTINSNSNLSNSNGEWTLIIGNGTTITIEGTLIVYGDILNSNSTGGATFSIANGGLVQGYGGYKTDNGNIDISGTGNFLTTGPMLTQGSSSEIFNSKNDCTTGPCSGQSLTCGTSSSAYTASITPISQTVCSGTAGGTLTFTTNIPATTTYRWMSSSTINGTYAYVTASATLPSPSPNATATLSPGTINSTTWFKVEYINSSSGCGTKYSAAVPIYITGALVAQSTAGQTQCAGGSFGPISVTASGTGLSYQWYSNAANSNIGGTLIPGATSSVYTPQPTSSPTYYYCIISASGCSTPVTSAVSGAFNVSTNNWTGLSSTSWSDTGNWSCGKIPTSLIDLTLTTGLPRYPLIAAGQTVSVNNLTINNGASFTLSATSTVNISGNFTNNGTFSSSSNTGGTMNFNGTTQSINGSSSTNFFNLNISNTSGTVTLNSNANLYGTMNISSGSKFDAAGTLSTPLLTLKSTAITQHGSIGVLPTSSSPFSGNIKVERFMDALGGTFRYISSPVTSNPAKPTGIDKLYEYNNGWVGAGTLVSGKGYAALVYNNVSVNWSVIGPILTGDAPTWNLPTEGWYLLGNPHPSSIQWSNNASAWTLSNVSSIIGVTDNHGGSYPTYFKYSDYNSSTPSWGNGALSGGVIAMGQAFWVYANAGGGSVTLKQAAKSTNNGSFYRNTGGTEFDDVSIILSNEKVVDQTFLRIQERSTEGYEFGKDLPKLWNDQMNVYLLEKTKREMLINAIPKMNKSMEIPIGIKVSEPGDYTLSFSNTDKFSYGGLLYLIDAQEQVVVPVSNADHYSFTVKVANQPVNDRFYLSLSPTVQERKESNTVMVYPNPAVEHLKIEIKGQKSAAPVMLLDMNGKSVRSMEIKKEGTIDISNLTSGFYILKVQTEQGVHVQKVVKQ